jgi:hypothetical protein
LADAARTYGPFVGIGKPGELRFAGAARECYDNDSWRPAVLDFMDRSGFIIAIVGVTPGLDWEIRQLLAHDRLPNTIFVFLPYATDSTARFRKFRQLLAGSPEGRGLQQMDLSNARVLHYSLRRGWIAIKSDWVSEGVYQAALDVAVFGLKVDAGR